jgi:hypothetical protein
MEMFAYIARGIASLSMRTKAAQAYITTDLDRYIGGSMHRISAI